MKKTRDLLFICLLLINGCNAINENREPVNVDNTPRMELLDETLTCDEICLHLLNSGGPNAELLASIASLKIDSNELDNSTVEGE